MLKQLLVYVRTQLTAWGLGAKQEKGQGLIEYALIILLVVIVVIAAISLLGPQIAQVYTNITTTLTQKGVVVP